jgi:hypothetical protein
MGPGAITSTTVPRPGINLAAAEGGKWSSAHEELLQRASCDVWLLTEVSAEIKLAGYHHHFGREPMAPNRHWAAVLSRDPFDRLDDPHPASAACEVGGTTYCSSVLPWRTSGAGFPWRGASLGARMRAALDELRPRLTVRSLVWGGDWNQSLLGPNFAGSAEGRTHLTHCLTYPGLQSPVAGLSHQLPDAGLTIDHVAVGFKVPVTATFRVPATLATRLYRITTPTSSYWSRTIPWDSGRHADGIIRGGRARSARPGITNSSSSRWRAFHAPTQTWQRQPAS